MNNNLLQGYNETDCMFCDVFSSHKTSYQIKSATAVPHSVKLNHTIISNGTSDHPSTLDEVYLTEKIWESLRYSKFYKKDYSLFDKIRTEPFQKDLYLQYPPAKLNLSRH